MLASLAVATLLASALMNLTLATTGQAAFLGKNGEIAFESTFQTGGDFEIISALPDGSMAKNLTNNTVDEWEPAWSPDGARIAFVRQITSNNTRVFVMNADGSEQVGLEAATSHGAMRPTWSPDGKRIAFQWGQQLCFIDADGRDKSCPAYFEGADHAAWSSKNKIAFVKGVEGFSHIFTANPDGSEMIDISNCDGFRTEHDYSPNWSPDGSKLVFVNGNLPWSRVYTMNADGLNRQPFGGESGFFGQWPVWSPDGNQITLENSGVTSAAGVAAPVETIRKVAEGTNVDWQPNTAPVVTPLRPSPGATTTDRTPRISAKVTDPQTDLALQDITLTLDDRTISRRVISYDSTTDRLQYTTPSALPIGRHVIMIVVEDSVEMAMTKRWRFRIIRQ